MASSSDEDMSSDYLYPLPTTIAIGVVTSFLAVVTTAFNAITLLAFVLSRSLRNFGDYFILNLAIADLAIGVLSIPPYIPYLLTGQWSAGKAYCLFWLLWDYVTPAASTFNMCVISIDRYLLVAHPIWYRKYQSTRALLLMMLSPWIIVTLVYGPSILLWEVITGEATIEEGQCYVPYAHSISFLLVGSFVEFIFPFVVMAVINCLIFINIRRRSKRRVGATVVRDAGTAAASNAFSTQVAPLNAQPTSMGGPSLVKLNACSSSTEEPRGASDSNPEASRRGPDDEAGGDTTEQQQQQQQQQHHHHQQQHQQQQQQQRQQGSESPKQRQVRDSSNLNRDRKAARSLFILVFIFALCWLPYEVLALISAVCPTCINPVLFEVSFWLLWLNSTINPILYPLLHRRFRDAFFTIMRKAKCCM